MSFTTVNSGAATITMGTPGTLTSATTNSLTTTSHTHSITNFALSGTANQITVSGAGRLLGAASTLSIAVPLIVAQGAGSATIQANNSFSSTVGLASIQGTSSAGNVYISTYRSILSSNRRAAIFAELGSQPDTLTKYAGFFNGRVNVVNNTVTISANTTLSETHAGVTVFCTNATAITITVPADASNLAFPPGTEITFIRRGAGTVTIATTNISLFSVGSGTANLGRRAIANQNEGVILIKDTANT